MKNRKKILNTNFFDCGLTCLQVGWRSSSFSSAPFFFANPSRQYIDTAFCQHRYVDFILYQVKKHVIFDQIAGHTGLGKQCRSRSNAVFTLLKMSSDQGQHCLQMVLTLLLLSMTCRLRKQCRSRSVGF